MKKINCFDCEYFHVISDGYYICEASIPIRISEKDAMKEIENIEDCDFFENTKISI